MNVLRFLRLVILPLQENGNIFGVAFEAYYDWTLSMYSVTH